MPKLFHLYPNKKAILSNVVDMMYDAYCKYTGNGKMRVVEHFIRDKTQRAQYRYCCDVAEGAYGESFKVLNTVLCHSKRTSKQGNTWANEFEIPLETFERGIHTARRRILNNELLAGKGTDLAKHYANMVSLLNEILTYRRENE